MSYKNQKKNYINTLMVGLVMIATITVTNAIYILNTNFAQEEEPETITQLSTRVSRVSPESVMTNNTVTRSFDMPMDIAFHTPVLIEEVEDIEEPSVSYTSTRMPGVIIVDSYDIEVDYTREISIIMNMIEERPDERDSLLALAEIYQLQQNIKILENPDRYSDLETSFLFSSDNSYEEIYAILNPAPPKYMEYTDAELYKLAAVVYGEAGADIATDEHQRAVASVVINRVNSSLFPNDIYSVVYAPGQYPGTCNLTNYNDRTLANVKYVLDNGPINDGIWQAGFVQGNEIIAVYDYPGVSWAHTTYICK